MSFEIQKEPQVHGSAEQQVLLQVEHLKRTVKSPHDLVEHIIQLYGAEFAKANARIAELQAANDNLFLVKQKTVIANRGLIQHNAELQARLGLLPAITDRLREAHARVQDKLAAGGGNFIGVVREHVLALCEFVERYEEATCKPMDAAAIEAHKRKAEDTPA